jgi:triosephosphate isomerase (TIM)
MRSKLVAGNWKLHGGLAANEALLRAVRSMADGLHHAACAVCVPYPYLAQAQSMLEGGKAQWGAQDVSDHASGAYTGEVAAGMLAEFGCRYAIVGHSERRSLHGETDALVAAKFAATLGAGLTPILCVGETLAERDAGVTEAVVGRQVDAVVSRCGIEAFAKAVLAYEPVWAIGTGRTASPDQAQAVHAFIRRGLAGRNREVAEQVRILYGGSVKAANAAELFAMADVDGGLIGGASLIADEFAAICRAADR